MRKTGFENGAASGMTLSGFGLQGIDHYTHHNQNDQKIKQIRPEPGVLPVGLIAKQLEKPKVYIVANPGCPFPGVSKGDWLRRQLRFAMAI